MPLPTPYPGGVLLQANSHGEFNRQHSSLTYQRTLGAAIPLGSVVMIDTSDVTQVLAHAVANYNDYLGVLVATVVDGQIDYTRVPAAGDQGLIAVPPCIVDVILDATIAAGAAITPDAGTDGRVDAWATTNDYIGYLLEGGDQGDLVQAVVTPLDAARA